MLPKKHRFLFNKNNRFTGFYLWKTKESLLITLKFKKNNFKEHRFIIIISAKIIRLATQRNLLRRRITGILREFLLKNNKNDKFDLLIKVKSEIKKQTFQVIKNDLLKLLESI